MKLAVRQSCHCIAISVQLPLFMENGFSLVPWQIVSWQLSRWRRNQLQFGRQLPVMVVLLLKISLKYSGYAFLRTKRDSLSNTSRCAIWVQYYMVFSRYLKKQCKIFTLLRNIPSIVQYLPHCAILATWLTTLCNIYHIVQYLPHHEIFTIFCNIHHIAQNYHFVQHSPYG